jgi:colicin import membrane protein
MEDLNRVSLDDLKSRLKGIGDELENRLEDIEGGRFGKSLENARQALERAKKSGGTEPGYDQDLQMADLEASQKMQSLGEEGKKAADRITELQDALIALETTAAKAEENYAQTSASGDDDGEEMRGARLRMAEVRKQFAERRLANGKPDILRQIADEQQRVEMINVQKETVTVEYQNQLNEIQSKEDKRKAAEKEKAEKEAAAEKEKADEAAAAEAEKARKERQKQAVNAAETMYRREDFQADRAETLADGYQPGPSRKSRDRATQLDREALNERSEADAAARELAKVRGGDADAIDRIIAIVEQMAADQKAADTKLTKLEQRERNGRSLE